MRHPIHLVPVAAVVLALAACAPDGGSVAPTSAVSVTTEAPTATTLPADDRPPPSTTEPPKPIEVGVAVRVPTAAIDTELRVEVADDEVDSLDPFGRFASCSGVRDAIGAYSVVVSDPGASEVSAVSLLTEEPIDRTGPFDADVRVERPGAAPIVAGGTITIEPGYRSGSFLAFAPDGAEVSGTFECDGVTIPAPLANLTDGDARSIDVVALLRRQDAERVVGAAVRSDLVDAACPALDGDGSDVLVRLDGDQRAGAVTNLELVDGADPALSLRVGGVEFVVPDVEIDPVDGVDDVSAAAFSGVAVDGTSVDGAYHCS